MSLDAGLRSWSCPRCGIPLRERPRVRLEFDGEGIEILGWMLLAIPAGALVLPLPWWFAAVCRWFYRNLVFTDGTDVEFQGRGGEIFWWYLFTCAGIGVFWGPPWPDTIVMAALALAVWLAAVYARLAIARWCVARARFGSVERFRFYGTYRELLGWHILNGLAVITIIGWAWTAAATGRWAAESTRSQGRGFAFHGSGFEILWRTVSLVLMCLPVLTIPWALLWYLRWIVSQVTVGSRTTVDEFD